MAILDFTNRQEMGRLCHSVAPLLLVLTIALAGCGSPGENAPAKIIAGSSLITDIIADLTDASVVAFTLLPSSSCPSQFDMKAGDIGRLQQASAVFLHPWQMQLANIRRVIDAAKLPEGRLHIVEVDGNWMLPEIQASAVTTLAAMLGEMRPDRRDTILQRAEARCEKIAEVANRAREALLEKDISGIVVLCNEMQAPFVRWVGFEAAATYARPEDWSVAETERLVKLGRERNVALLIDNLQSGGMSMSETLARDIGAGNVVLSNFPNGFPDTPTWEAAFLENINRLKEACARLIPHES